MPKISVTPVKKVNISICVADLDSLEQKVILMTLIDEVTASFEPSGFIDPCQLNQYWIDILEPVDSDKAGDFVQKVCQAYDLVVASKV